MKLVSVDKFKTMKIRYSLLIICLLMSLIGTWIQRIATPWLVYRITGSTFLLGVVGFAGQIPTFLLAPFAGVLVDRWNRYHILVATQILAMLQAFALAILFFMLILICPLRRPSQLSIISSGPLPKIVKQLGVSLPFNR